MNNLKIALIGYGRMGKEIEKVALSKEHVIQARIDTLEDWVTQKSLLLNSNVAIDFSIPEIAISNMKRCLKLNIPLVIGTTGWYEQMNEIEDEVNLKNGSLLWASNFSLGVNITFHFNKLLAKTMARFPEYKVHIHEIHHTQKLDAPSGTAISLANGIIDSNELLDTWKLEESHEIESSYLPISHAREGQVPGTHEIRYTSDIDEIMLRHEAKNRKGFASGAVLAAEWLVGKKGFYNMSDVLGFESL
ncbi:4-hydroxy-tetrahydrodipicolinate reductase [Lentimicrobium sp. S6]|uniref:4-hydroxy-tetrahydrodipicolinate reductase n=1 Tax=Lentimicrobium sp. S6 TaxID=2735872 RepID=UPI001555E413|nr:4-hydroxy-tetrahydrodipicolinate reductase [Lentimicrobium sp. S6]NPD46000.1 4-hydroxy-tetrahydrodipicolinate reductase [Lentimicrobium sp. S6]